VFYNNLVFADKMNNYPDDSNGVRKDPLIKLPAGIKNWEGLDKMKYFGVQPGSPAIDAGKAIENSVQKDYNGTVVPQNLKTDIGAFEYRDQRLKGR